MLLSTLVPIVFDYYSAIHLILSLVTDSNGKHDGEYVLVEGGKTTEFMLQL